MVVNLYLSISPFCHFRYPHPVEWAIKMSGHTSRVAHSHAYGTAGFLSETSGGRTGLQQSYGPTRQTNYDQAQVSWKLFYILSSQLLCIFHREVFSSRICVGLSLHVTYFKFSKMFPSSFPSSSLNHKSLKWMFSFIHMQSIEFSHEDRELLKRDFYKQFVPK